MTTKHQFISIAKDKLYPHKGQPRKHISDEVVYARRRQLEQEGQLAPILVFPADAEGRHELVDGECRWRAALESDHLELLNAEIYLGDREDLAGLLVTQLLRNDDGSAPLTALEKAISYKRLISHFEEDDEKGSSLKQAADRLGMDYTTFTRTLKVSEMSGRLSEFVLDRGIDDRRAINGLMRVERMATQDRVDELFNEIRHNDEKKENHDITFSTREIVALACKELKAGSERQKRGTKEKVKRKLAARKIQLKEGEGGSCLVIETPREVITFELEEAHAELFKNAGFSLSELVTKED